MAASETQRAIGPHMSWRSEHGEIPRRLTRPRVGRMPTREQALEGERIEFMVSVPVPMTARLAATAAPVPPEDPPGVRVRSYGLSVWPLTELMVMPLFASSVRFALPRMTAPDWRSLLVVSASCAGTKSLNARAPLVVGMSQVSQLSLRTTGIPCKGPRTRPAWRSRSRRSASSKACGFTVMSERRIPS